VVVAAFGSYQYSELAEAAVKLLDEKGVLLVTAAGNGGWSAAAQWVQ